MTYCTYDHEKEASRVTLGRTGRGMDQRGGKHVQVRIRRGPAGSETQSATHTLIGNFQEAAYPILLGTMPYIYNHGPISQGD